MFTDDQQINAALLPVQKNTKRAERRARNKKDTKGRKAGPAPVPESKRRGDENRQRVSRRGRGSGKRTSERRR